MRLTISFVVGLLVLFVGRATCSDVNSELDTINELIGQRNLAAAILHSRNVTDYSLAHQSATSAAVAVGPLPFTAGTGDLSYLTAMVEQVRSAYQTGDFVRMREYSVSLGIALGKEISLAEPNPSTKLQTAEQSLVGLRPIERYLKLPRVAKAAVDAGDISKASLYASELLETASRQHSWPQGDAVFQGNIVLGRVALLKGDLSSAAERLIAAGKTTGSPVLNSFGPGMVLARDLLAEGRSADVLQFFEECRAFWSSGGSLLSSWATSINAGKTPDFAANLLY